MTDYLKTNVEFHPLDRTKRADSPADGQHLQSAAESFTVRGVVLQARAETVRSLAGVQARGGWLFYGPLPQPVPVGTEARFVCEGRRQRARVEQAIRASPAQVWRVVLTEVE